MIFINKFINIPKSKFGLGIFLIHFVVFQVHFLIFVDVVYL